MTEATRAHDRRRYVALLHGVHAARRSAVLEVQSGRHWRRLYFLGGAPVAYASDLPTESLAQTLVQAGVVTAKQMQWVKGKLAPGEPLEGALLVGGLVEPDALEEHQRVQIERGAAAALHWEQGTWDWKPADARLDAAFDAQLRRPVDLLRALWQGVQTHVRMDAVLPFVTADGLGPLQPTERLAGLLAALTLEAPLDRVGEVLVEQPSVEDLFRRIPDRSGHLVQLVWMLEAVGGLRRPGRAADPDLDALADGSRPSDAAPTAASREPSPARARRGGTSGEFPRDPSSGELILEDLEDGESGEIPLGSSGVHAAVTSHAGMPSLDAAARERDGVGRSSGVGWRPPARNLAELLRTAHKHRMGKDCYTFLDLKPQASKDEIKQAYHRLVRVWEAAGQDPEIPADARDAAGELVAAAIFAFRTLTDDERRVEYDRRMERGQAPLLTGLHGADASQITNTNANIRSVPASTNPAIRAMPKSSPGMPAASPKMDEVRRLMDKGDFGAAMPLLQALRLESPSSADVLADLGWCVWKLRNRRDGADDEADEYLQLAATFDPKHVRALEYLARMAKDRGDLEGARRRVRRLLEVDPRNAWARGAQKSLEEASPEADQSAPGAALRFWKRRG